MLLIITPDPLVLALLCAHFPSLYCLSNDAGSDPPNWRHDLLMDCDCRRRFVVWVKRSPPLLSLFPAWRPHRLPQAHPSFPSVPCPFSLAGNDHSLSFSPISLWPRPSVLGKRKAHFPRWRKHVSPKAKTILGICWWTYSFTSSSLFLTEKRLSLHSRWCWFPLYNN